MISAMQATLSDILNLREISIFPLPATPECHVEAPDMITDIKYLKEKVDAGAEHLMSQLITAISTTSLKRQDSRHKRAYRGRIMPVVNKKQIERMVSMCGASLPVKFTRMMARYENNPEALRDAGIAYAIDQIVDLYFKRCGRYPPLHYEQSLRG